ncbi:hypothetical protein KBI51_05225 [Aerococcaceae bacterium zg-ZUI334]|uniref:glycoside hydrolase family 2 protein n=1 Tax=Aerococcaceae bacterium zg-252 TaxID=2796928 RepID=UPI001BA2096D|nr:hypothetical protein [Aerococcaceae bacterium zg-ZUI334]
MKRVNINQNWEFIKGQESMPGEWSKVEKVTLPHTWNAIDGQDGGNDYFRGSSWYRRELGKIDIPSNGRVYLEFDGVGMIANIFINNRIAGSHEGGYSRFRLDITDYIDTNNELLVQVSNEKNHVYPQTADFTFYGGIYRDVHLVIVPEMHFDLDYFGSNGLKVTPKVIDLEGKIVEISIEAWTKNAEKIIVSFLNKEYELDVKNDKAEGKITLNNARLWDGINDPFLYELEAKLENGETISTKFGCRKFEVDPQKGFMLNGRAYPLRGVSRHQDFKGIGNAISIEQEIIDMDLITEIGANSIRLAHYQHSQSFYDLCDEKGMCVWAEIPYITMNMKNGVSNTLSQMQELVVQNYNHPSIVCWGLSNEITAASIVNEELLENHRILNNLCHELDKTRPTTMANVFMLETDSPILDIPDINAYNLYYGWYLGELEDTNVFFDEFHEKYPDKAMGFSEYGADANIKFQSSKPEKGDYTESYQSIYHEHMINMIEDRPWLWSTYVWNMFDFAADGRDEGGEHGLNQKGLVTFDRKVKKDAFYAYKSVWSKEPFVHICGRRYKDRVEEITEIKVYSNLESVDLYVDGKLFERKANQRFYTFEVPISFQHVIEAKSGEFFDCININKVSEPNLDYVLNKKAAVLNWFDDEEIDPEFYSVNDTLAEIRKHPEARSVLDAMMNQNTASRGEVAERVKDNPALQRMMGRMTLISLLKQSGDTDPETAKHLNRIFQKIKKG